MLSATIGGPAAWTIENNGQTFIIRGDVEEHPMGAARPMVASTGWHNGECFDGRRREPSDRQARQAAQIAALPLLVNALRAMLNQWDGDADSIPCQLAREALVSARSL